MKYLDVILDSKLSGNSHVKQKICKAISKKYGTKPILMRKVYNRTVIPALCHGCHVFGDKCQQGNIKNYLNISNKLASLLMAGVAPSAPTNE